MKIGSKYAAKVSKAAADFATSSGLADIGVIRKLGVGVMDRVVPDSEVTIRVVDDITMRVNPQEDGRWYYFADKDREGTSEGPESWLLTSHLSEGDTVLDVGAHIGYMSLLSRSCVGSDGTVVAFEPLPRNFDRLQRNVEMNGFDNVRVEQLAISNKPGELTLYEGDKTIRATTVEDVFEGASCTTVESRTIDSYVAEHGLHPDLVKMNAEGIEYDALRGMEATLRATHPTVFVEIHPNHLESKGASATDVLSLLIDTGYGTLIADGQELGESAAYDLASKRSEPFRVIAKHE